MLSGERIILSGCSKFGINNRISGKWTVHPKAGCWLSAQEMVGRLAPPSPLHPSAGIINLPLDLSCLYTFLLQIWAGPIHCSGLSSFCERTESDHIIKSTEKILLCLDTCFIIPAVIMKYLDFRSLAQC